MAYVVTQACIGNKHTDCADVCPVEAFREGPEMLYIDPDACIDCNACFSACPEQAIFPASTVPAGQERFIALNAEQSRVMPVIVESIGKAAAAPANSGDRPGARFAVVGSGPSGFYTVEELLKWVPSAQVDLFERLPTPFGLVRYGVAPDHPRIKSVSAGFERIASLPQVRFFGNVAIGGDLSAATLQSHYHAVVYATGGASSRPLELPGADAGNSVGSAEFVGWYNGHPDHQCLQPNLNHTRVAVVGMGNVALDIARMLVLPEDTLRATDIADPALAALAASAVQEVCLLARRGAAQAAFTPKELEQLMAIPGLELVVDAADLALDTAGEQQLQRPEQAEARQNLALLRAIAARPRNAVPGAKRIRFIFCASPRELLPAAQGFKLVYARNQLKRDAVGNLRAEATDDLHSLELGLLVHATGYRGEAIESLPFDADRGVIPSAGSRVEGADNCYVAGWIKRGPSGVIGSNRQCAAETVARLVENLPPTVGPVEADIATTLDARGVGYVSFDDWRLLDQHELAQGRLEGRARRKVTDIDAMLALIREARTRKAAEDAAQASLPVREHFRSCTLCEAMCGVQITVQGERILSIAGDPEDQHSRGHICPKGYSLQDLHNDPDRLKKPLHKVDGQWLEISWEEALDLAAEKLVGIQQQYGSDAVAGYWGNPTSHNFGLMMATGKFRKVLGSKNLFTAASLDQMPHQLVSYLMFGLANAFTIPDIDHTDYMLMLGANPAASNGSLMSAGDVLARLEGIKARGGKLVLVDPRRNETAHYASEHHFIRPATDALLLVGMIQHIVENQLYKPGHLEPMLSHWDEMLALFDLFPMAEIAALTGIAENEIIRITEEFCTAESAICYGRMGISAAPFGALNHWLINVLNIITGNLDRRGGMMFTTPAMDVALKPNTAGSFASYHTRVRGLPEFNREFPAAAMAEEMLTPGEGQVKGFICFAGNPVLSTPNGMQLEQALEQLDFMVSVDFYLNETSRHADLILPPTGPLEHEQFDLVFNLLAVRNVAKFSDPLFAHGPEALSDWDILQGLSKRMAALKGIALKGPDATTTQILDFALRSGPYAESFDEYRGGEVIHHATGLNLEALAKHPHGLDLGPLKPRLPGHLLTPGQQIQMLPPAIIADLQRLQNFYHALREEQPLMLIGRRDLRTNNSWMHNSQRLVKGGDRCALYMHPDDAAERGLASASRARVSSRVGELEVALRITDEVMPGVVCLPHGWGHAREGVQLRVAATNPGVNKNELTDEQLIDTLSGNAVLNGVPVEVSAL